jgi:hypothetical protein
MSAEHPGGFRRGGVVPLICHGDGEPRATAINHVVDAGGHVGDHGTVLLIHLEIGDVVPIMPRAQQFFVAAT